MRAASRQEGGGLEEIVMDIDDELALAMSMRMPYYDRSSRIPRLASRADVMIYSVQPACTTQQLLHGRYGRRCTLQIRTATASLEPPAFTGQ